MQERLPIGVYRARGALQRLRANLAAGRRIAPSRGEVYLMRDADPVLRAQVERAVAAGVARVAADYAGHTFSEGPGQHDRGLLTRTADPQWVASHDRTAARVLPGAVCEQCEHVDGHSPDCPLVPVTLGTFRDLLAGWLGQWGSTVDSIKAPTSAGFPTLTVRLFSGQTIKIILREVPESAHLQ